MAETRPTKQKAQNDGRPADHRHAIGQTQSNQVSNGTGGTHSHDSRTTNTAETRTSLQKTVTRKELSPTAKERIERVQQISKTENNYKVALQRYQAAKSYWQGTLAMLEKQGEKTHEKVLNQACLHAVAELSTIMAVQFMRSKNTKSQEERIKPLQELRERVNTLILAEVMDE